LASVAVGEHPAKNQNPPHRKTHQHRNRDLGGGEGRDQRRQSQPKSDTKLMVPRGRLEPDMERVHVALEMASVETWI
jgi:hypothetical protein